MEKISKICAPTLADLDKYDLRDYINNLVEEHVNMTYLGTPAEIPPTKTCDFCEDFKRLYRNATEGPERMCLEKMVYWEVNCLYKRSIYMDMKERIRSDIPYHSIVTSGHYTDRRMSKLVDSKQGFDYIIRQAHEYLAKMHLEWKNTKKAIGMIPTPIKASEKNQPPREREEFIPKSGPKKLEKPNLETKEDFGIETINGVPINMTRKSEEKNRRFQTKTGYSSSRCRWNRNLWHHIRSIGNDYGISGTFTTCPR